MNRSFLLASLLLPLCGATTSSLAEPPPSESDSAAIRETRARFNRAIEARDVAAMDGLFTTGYVLITGRGDRFRGRDANRSLWVETFHRDPSFQCRRTPDDIAVNAGWGIAQETGHWVCTQTVAGDPGRYTGVFAAKWQRATDGRWMLQSEVFTTLTCDGPPAACLPPDPVPGVPGEPD